MSIVIVVRSKFTVVVSAAVVNNGNDVTGTIMVAVVICVIVAIDIFVAYFTNVVYMFDDSLDYKKDIRDAPFAFLADIRVGDIVN